MTENGGVTTKENLATQPLSERAIVLPRSPYWEIIQDIGKGEATSLGINTLGVFALSQITDNRLALSVAGPVLEYFGFFLSSSKKQFDLWKTTLPEQRMKKNEYLKRTIQGAWQNIVKDFVLPDPVYFGTMLLELRHFPETPPWMLSVFAFMISLGTVSAIEVGVKEGYYKRQVHQLIKRGFSFEKQLESRFIVREGDSENILSELADQFQLGEIHTSTYHDTYFKPSLESYNSRQPQVRLRTRYENGEAVGPEEIQVIYNHASKLKRRNPEQYNYYPVARDKFQRVHDEKSQRYLREMISSLEKQEVTVTRQYAHIPGKILISTDKVEDSQHPYTEIEVKAYRDQKDAVAQMIMAMRQIMSQYRVVQTTHSKQSLINIRKW